MSADRKAALPASPLKVSTAEADCVFEQISVIARTASGLAAQALEEAGTDLMLTEKNNGTQKLLEMIGGLGRLGRWKLRPVARRVVLRAPGESR